MKDLKKLIADGDQVIGGAVMHGAGKEDLEKIFREVHAEHWKRFCTAVDKLTEEGTIYLDDDGYLFEVPYNEIRS